MDRRPIVIVTRRLTAPVETILLDEFDAHLNRTDTRFDETAMRQAMLSADAVLTSIGDGVGESVFPTTTRARIIANFGVGTDHIALDAARRAGIVVTNTPGALTECTADLTVALILAVMRRLGEAEREIRDGRWTGWRPTHMLGTRVSGRTLGIIGFGRIGQAVARRAHRGFGMRVLFHTPNPPPPDVRATLGAEARADLDDLLREADIVSIHTPSNPATRHLLDERRIGLMRNSAFLVNTARGEIVDEAALITALREGRIAGAGLDVFENEPAIRPELRETPNLVMLPHIGSATVETRTAMGMLAIENLRAFFAGRVPPDRVA
jgi:lactate dehydrogenase-like 2-hydroxyacid dehydrogenase